VQLRKVFVTAPLSCFSRLLWHSVYGLTQHWSGRPTSQAF
jgi:hypothetical protein